MIYYNCYESGFEGTYSTKDLEKIYETCIDKKEYDSFDIWLADMLKTGIFVLDENIA